MGGSRSDPRFPSAEHRQAQGGTDPDTRSGVHTPGGLDWDDETLIQGGHRSEVPHATQTNPLAPDYPAIASYGRFEILGRLAVGGMAEVFLARELGAHNALRHVAIKRILPEIADDPTFVEMFLDEARLAVQLNHPNICHTYDFGELDDTYFIAMEWVNGVPFGRVIKHAKETTSVAVPIPIASKVIAHIAEALHYAHQARDGLGRPMNIVHRDISPQNIMVRFDGVVKLLDFGIAKNAAQSTQTEAGIVKGKFSYMSPEQCLGRPLDARTDIFALGSCLYEALTGQSAFRRSSDLDTMRAIVHETPRPIASYRSDVPPALLSIVDSALEKDPRSRFQTAGDMFVALERFLTEQGEFIRAMHISHYVEQLLPGEAAAGPLANQASPAATVPSLDEPLPPAITGRRYEESTLDVNIAVIDEFDDEPETVALEYDKAHRPTRRPPVTAARSQETASPYMQIGDEDDGPTEQLGAKQVAAILGAALREPTDGQWVSDEMPTDDLRREPPTTPKVSLPTSHGPADPTAIVVEDAPIARITAPLPDRPFAAPSRGRRVFLLLLGLLVVTGIGAWLGLAPPWAGNPAPAEEPRPTDSAASVDRSDGSGRTTAAVPGPNDGAAVLAGTETDATAPAGLEGDAPEAPAPTETPAPSVAEETPTTDVAPPAGITRLIVRSTPSGARVRAGSRIGATPFTFDGLRPGTHTVTVFQPGFVQWRRAVRVTEGDPTELDVQLVPRGRTPRPDTAPAAPTGRLTLTTAPPATVYVDGQRLGQTPLRDVSVPAGALRLRLVDAEGETYLRSVRIREGQSNRAFLTLQN